MTDNLDRKYNSNTAAIEGRSERPGDPWETSIPKIIVGLSLITGTREGSSIANKELTPPSYKKKQAEGTNFFN